MLSVLLSFASLSHLLPCINTVLCCPIHLELHSTFQASKLLEPPFWLCLPLGASSLSLSASSIVSTVQKQKMLTCISCSKQVLEEDGNAEVARRTKLAAKSFTTQIKELRHKLKTCRGSTATGYNKGNMSLLPLDNIYHGIPYNSTTAWGDLRSSGHQHTDSSSQATFSSRQVICGRQSEDMLVNGEDGPQEWMAQVEPGVHITFAALPDGGNDLRRIRFSREKFNKWQAQCWWGENFDRILELYNVCRFNRQAPLPTEDGRDSSCSSRLGSLRDSPTTTPWESYRPYGYQRQTGFSTYSGNGAAASNDTATSSRDEVSMSGYSEVENEWVEQDEPGVYITIRQMVDGTRELRRVRFSRERFVEVDAKQWWEANRARIQAQYL